MARENKLKFKTQTISHRGTGPDKHLFKVGVISGLTSNYGIFYHEVEIGSNNYETAEQMAHQATYEAFAAKMRKLLMED